MDGHSRRWRRARRKFLFTTSLALFLFFLQNASARPCSESDVYPGYPIQKHDHKWGRPRPHPHLTGPRFDDPCSLLDLVNADLTADEALLLIRCIRYAENGEYRNLTIDQNLDGTKIDGVGISSVALDGVTSLGDAGVTLLAGYFNTTEPFPYPVQLTLAAAAVSSVGATAISAAVGAAGSTIDLLRLDWNEGIGDVGARALGNALRGNTALRTLGLERCGIGDVGAAGLAASLVAPSASTARATVSASGGMATAAIRGTGSLVRALHLEGNRIGPTGAAAFANALHTSRIEKLALALNPIGPQGAQHLARALKQNSHLRELDLADCGIGDDGAEALGIMLRSNTVLRKLKLQGNRIGSRGAEAIAAALRINGALRELNLRGNNLDAPAGVTLLDAVRHTKSTPQAGPSLSALYLEHCYVLPTLEAPAPMAINATLLAEVARVVAA